MHVNSRYLEVVPTKSRRIKYFKLRKSRFSKFNHFMISSGGADPGCTDDAVINTYTESNHKLLMDHIHSTTTSDNINHNYSTEKDTMLDNTDTKMPNINSNTFYDKKSLGGGKYLYTLKVPQNHSHHPRQQLTNQNQGSTRSTNQLIPRGPLVCDNEEPLSSIINNLTSNRNNVMTTAITTATTPTGNHKLEGNNDTCSINEQNLPCTNARVC